MPNYEIFRDTFDLGSIVFNSIIIDFKNGICVEILDFGAIIKRIEVPDFEGNRKNIVLSYSDMSAYLTDTAYLGCVVGRYANRIKNGKFIIDGKQYQVSQNEAGNHLHGGAEGFSKKLWRIKSVEQREKVSIELTYTSADGEEGYPGNLDVAVRYIVSERELVIEYRAETDQSTIFNPTSHSYFNLSGDFTRKIDDHFLAINAHKILSKDDQSIPDGDYNFIENTEFDFKKRREIGTKAFDDCYVINGEIVLEHQESARRLRLKTSFPSAQLYTGDYLNQAGLINRSGVCLETQFFPDSPNHRAFPNTLLRKGMVFSHKTAYSFETIKEAYE